MPVGATRTWRRILRSEGSRGNFRRRRVPEGREDESVPSFRAGGGRVCVGGPSVRKGRLLGQ